MRLLTCCLRGFFTCDATKRGADGHADTGGIALAQYVASHHLTGNEQVTAGGACEVNRSVFIHFQSQVGKGDPRSQGITVVRGRINRPRPVRFRWRQALRRAVIQLRVIKLTRLTGLIVVLHGMGKRSGSSPNWRASSLSVLACAPGKTGGIK